MGHPTLSMLSILGECAPPMIPPVHDDLASQHYQAQQYPGYNCVQPDFSNYGPMYSNYMKCRTNPYQRPQSSSASPSPNVSAAAGLASSAAMYYPGFTNAAAAAAAAGLYARPHNMYDYSGMPHHTEVPRWFLLWCKYTMFTTSRPHCTGIFNFGHVFLKNDVTYQSTSL